MRAAEGVYGGVRARKRVEIERAERVEGRAVEHGHVERLSPAEDDSGEIEHLPDGSVSIPLFEERLVVRKELVVRERVVVRKRTVRNEHRIETNLRRERIDVQGEMDDGHVRHSRRRGDQATNAPRRVGNGGPGTAR